MFLKQLDLINAIETINKYIRTSKFNGTSMKLIHKNDRQVLADLNEEIDIIIKSNYTGGAINNRD